MGGLPCTGDCCGCAGDDPFKPTPAPQVAHGSYTVKSGDSCWNIADSLCQDGNDWKTVICNGAAACSALQPGQVLNYDCLFYFPLIFFSFLSLFFMFFFSLYFLLFWFLGF